MTLEFFRNFSRILLLSALLTKFRPENSKYQITLNHFAAICFCYFLTSTIGILSFGVDVSGILQKVAGFAPNVKREVLRYENFVVIIPV